MKKDETTNSKPANESSESFEFEGFENAIEPWDTGDDSFGFETEEVDEEHGDEPSANDIGMLLSALAGTETDPQTELAGQEEERVESNSVEPESSEPESQFETLANDGDESAIQELIADVELRDAYLDDALKCLASMEQCALALESDLNNKESIQQFCRELHTLKGASASVGLSELASYLHDLETSLDESFKNETGKVEVDPMFAAVDRVRTEISKLTSPGNSDEAALEQGVAPAGRGQDFSNFNSNDDSSIRIRAAKLDRLMDMLAELVVLRNRRESHASEFYELNDELTRCATRLRFAEEQPETNLTASVYNGRNGGSQTISEIAKDITAVAQGLGELQTPVSHDNQSISRFIRDFRQELMQLRRVPVSGLFHRLQRAVRDAANAESKQVRLEIHGENTGLEQEIQERLYEPLLHIVRNAVSHGIESPQQRTQAGKNAQGTISVEAHSNAQRLVIEVRDDGGGINYTAVRNRAIEKGLIASTQTLPESELGKLIFHPGFSTREQASEVSGRGVGMDIVATTIEHLRGRVDVESKPNQGTTMRITIPLRTGIEHVMVFRSAGQLFALPMQSVKAVNESQRNVGVLLNLNEVLSLGTEKTAGNRDALLLRTSKKDESAKSLALSVDNIVGPEEVVVRGLPSALQQHPLFCGVTLSGSGETVLLLDSQRVEDFCLDHHELFQNSDIQEMRSANESLDQVRALVVDDSLTARKVLVKKLQLHGIASVEASDGIEALERLRSEQFDYVFTDLDMPRLGGIELLSDIQSQKYTDAPVIVVSSRSEEEFQSRAIELGAAAYLSKPIENNSFTRLMEDLQLQTQQSE